MVPQKVIFDNTVFNNAARFKSVDLLRLSRSIFTDKVLVPASVFAELGNYNPEFYPEFKIKISQIKETVTRSNYFHYCSDFDTLVHDILIKNVDAGEADAVAQSAKTNVRYIISDDSRAVAFINDKYPYIKTFSTYFILCIADIMGFLPDYNKAFAEYHDILQYNNFSPVTRKKHKARIRSEYSEALKFFSISSDKKRLSAKTSVDTILKAVKNL